VSGPPAAWRYGARTVWLPTASEMAELDRRAVGSGAIPERALIECAGRELAHRVHAHWPEGPVTALAGSGHNGADALVALRALHAWGRPVRAILAGSAPPEPDVLVGWDVPLEPAERFFDAPPTGGVLVDGILGTGISGPPREPQARLIEAANRLGLPIVAVDGPSGADLDTGAVPGACIRAELTVALGWPKLGLLRFPAREHCGRIEAVEIGFPPSDAPLGARAITGRWVADLLPRRPPDAHKGRAGYVAIVAGQRGMAGAAVLAARGAVRGGAGIVRTVSDPGNRRILQSSVPGAVFVAWDEEDVLQETIDWCHALAVGPGLGRGPGRRALVADVLERRGERPAVVDADGLSIWAGEPAALAELLRPGDVLTPHPGELARLLGVGIERVTGDPPGMARVAADRLGCTVVLKGAPTLVARGEDPLRVTTTGGPGLAAGGSGDVLTGLVAALLAGGARGPDAAAAALFLSGLAAEASADPVGHAAADVPDRLPALRREVRGLSGTSSGPILFVSADPFAPGGGRDT
jgi:ADP-dependent NAD(P)H-hydrate dehydratase / NAD(P)H-hydrate epimerase